MQNDDSDQERILLRGRARWRREVERLSKGANLNEKSGNELLALSVCPQQHHAHMAFAVVPGQIYFKEASASHVSVSSITIPRGESPGKLILLPK
jgi:hypothetical protein